MQSKLKILFRTSGGRAENTQLGMGHVYRCINLAKTLKNFENYFVIEDYGGVKKLLNEKDFRNIRTIPKKSSLKDDLKYTKTVILKNQIDILIIDKFNIKKKYVNELKKISKVIIISDLHKIDFKSNLVINGFLGFENKIVQNKYKTKLLLGPKYQILNNKFSKKQSKKKIFDLLVTFGGFDENKIVEKVLESLIKYRNLIKIKIILGPVSKKSKKIFQIKRKYPELIIVDKVNDLYNDIYSSRFGLCSGGITTYEFASAGVSFGIICQHRHQKITANEWEKRNLGTNLGFPNRDISKKVELFIENIITKKYLKNKNRKMIDGKGAQRIEKEILKMCKKDRNPIFNV